VEAVDHFEANAQRDGLVHCHGQLRTIAVTLFNVANNIRFLGSGPRCGFFEVLCRAASRAARSCPGKVNPVMCESMMQVAARVMGNDQVLALSGASGGQFQLNIMMPVMGHAALESIRLMAASTRAFIEFCAEGLEANEEACEGAVEQSLSMVTSLNPLIGYEKAAALAKEAFATGKTIRQLCREQGILPEATLQEALDPFRMTTSAFRPTSTRARRRSASGFSSTPAASTAWRRSGTAGATMDHMELERERGSRSPAPPPVSSGKGHADQPDRHAGPRRFHRRGGA
jgi:fumarate hydratase, class II